MYNSPQKVPQKGTTLMSQTTPQRDETFYKRADEHIALANSHINTQQVRPVDANDSLLYATARFNAWIVAASFTNPEEMQADKAHAITYFTEAYKKMLEEHFDDYVKNYDVYMGREKS
jgi:predicted metal-dependent hydrolase